MKTVEAKCVVVPMEVPAGTQPGPYNFKFFKSGEELPTLEVNSGVPSCTVSLDAGEWMCVAVRMNEAQDAQLGEEAFTTFIVPTAATVVIGVVGSVEVSVSETVKTVKKVSVK